MNVMLIGTMLLAAVFNGEWRETGKDDEIRLSLTKDGVGHLESKGGKLDFVWKAKGESAVEVCRRDGDTYPVLATFAYNTADDTFDLACGPARLPEGMTGILKRTSEEVTTDRETLARFKATLKKPDPMASFDRAARLKKAIAAKDPHVRQVTSLVEAIETDRLVRDKVIVISADAEYPRVVPAVGFARPGYCMYHFVTGCYMADPTAKHHEDPREGLRNRSCEPTDPPCQISVDPEKIKAFCDQMEKWNLSVVRSCFEHGKGKNYWREDALGVFVTSEYLPKFYTLLRETILPDGTTPRWIAERPM